jgi:hypothetical protein
LATSAPISLRRDLILLQLPARGSRRIFPPADPLAHNGKEARKHLADLVGIGLIPALPSAS